MATALSCDGESEIGVWSSLASLGAIDWSMDFQTDIKVLASKELSPK